jgi:hypothetical protein
VEIEKPEGTGDGFEYHPNMHEAGTGPACFLDQSRICGADCMAYLTKPPEGQAYQGEQWAHCHLLVNVDRTGRHLGIITTLVRNQQADQMRAQQAPKVK